MTFRIRPVLPDDRDFILSNWSSSYRSSHDIAWVPMDQYAVTYRPFYEALLDSCAALVAHGKLGVLMGFICYDPTSYVLRRDKRETHLDGHVLYLCVGLDFRRRGIARALFAAAGFEPGQRFGYAARTRATSILRHKIPNAVHDSMRSRYREIQGAHDERSEAAG